MIFIQYIISGMSVQSENVLEKVSGWEAVELVLQCIFLGLLQFIKLAIRRLWKGYRKSSKGFPPVELTVDSSIGIHCHIKLLGVKYHYVETGPKDGKIALILGDAPDAGNLWVPTWSSVVRRLAENDYHVITLDLRGTGGSEGGNRRELSPPQAVKELTALLQALGASEQNQAIVIGFGIGGMLAWLTRLTIIQATSLQTGCRSSGGLVSSILAKIHGSPNWRLACIVAAREDHDSLDLSLGSRPGMANPSIRSYSSHGLRTWYLTHCQGPLIRKFAVIGSPHPNLYWQYPMTSFCNNLHFIQWPHFPEKWLADGVMQEGSQWAGSRARDWSGALNYVRGAAWWRIRESHKAKPRALLVGARAGAAQLVASAQLCASPALRLVSDPGPKDPELPALILDFFIGKPKPPEDTPRGLMGRVLGVMADRGRGFTRLALTPSE